MESQVSRSQALNNLPKKKVQQKIIDIVSACPTCSSKGSLTDDLCKKCYTMSIAYNRYSDANIPLEYWDLKMEKDFQGYIGLLNKYQELTNDIKTTYIKGRSVCFAGNHGVGKSFTTSCILKKAAQKGYNALYTTLTDMVNVLTGAPTEEKYLAKRELVMVDFLAIDELDIRFFSASDATNDLFSRNFEHIFRTRKQNGLPTFICTNSPNLVESFKGMNKQSIGSLFSEIEQCPIIGEDFRKRK